MASMLSARAITFPGLSAESVHNCAKLSLNPIAKSVLCNAGGVSVFRTAGRRLRISGNALFRSQQSYNTFILSFFGWGDAEQVHSDVNSDRHEGSLTHELIAGAAGFEAMKAYLDHERENGKPQSHQFAKELVAGFAAAEADKLFETKGLDYLDRDTARQQAQDQAYALYDERYSDSQDSYSNQDA